MRLSLSSCIVVYYVPLLFCCWRRTTVTSSFLIISIQLFYYSFMDKTHSFLACECSSAAWSNKKQQQNWNDIVKANNSFLQFLFWIKCVYNMDTNTSYRQVGWWWHAGTSVSVTFVCVSIVQLREKLYQNGMFLMPNHENFSDRLRWIRELYWKRFNWHVWSQKWVWDNF